VVRRGSPNRIRIIGGSLGGRRLSFSAEPGLRPTPDRVRETLFNWLQPVIAGARCLDLFAGSGALGLEATSRGAGQVVLIDRSREVVRRLASQVQLLGLTGVEVVQADALAWLAGPARLFDIVFLDPPYDSGLQRPCCERLEERGWLAAGAHIYLEESAHGARAHLPASWTPSRDKHAGDVRYSLLRAPLSGRPADRL